ncbi:uncharacterized protein LOC110843343 [Folsomia candida]|uniref:uncharacterized protein LOC110843343 n=1 Tax=Folsomia candida TaxID=158441 RepID=UPI000B8F56DA|nr:uncharacterized protein LOC110843343 [Folsomia candida]
MTPLTNSPISKFFPSSNPRNLSNFLVLILILISSSNWSDCKIRDSDPDNRKVDRHNNRQFNNGSIAFVQIPHSNPPTVRPPPYTISRDKCPVSSPRENWVNTLCGDLNTGFVPQNPLAHKFSDGGTYPFDIIKNKTLEFFRRALPILKNNKSLPKVAKYASVDFQPQQSSANQRRGRRGIATRQPAYPSPLSDPYFPEDTSFYPDSPSPILSPSRKRRQYGPGPSHSNHNRFCENAMNYYNRLCKIYNAMWGKSPHKIQRETSMENRYYHPNQQQYNKGSGSPHHRSHLSRPSIDVTVIEPSNKAPKYLNTAPVTSQSSQNAVELPPTPCPSSAEYMTPVFARNHEGAWRYVVQIPKEGYFTQTVEVTKCLKSNCYYMDGSCKTSPRWQSLLVAELYYPDGFSSSKPLSSSGNSDFDRSGNDLTVGKSSSVRTKTDPAQCDGYHEGIGCYQVRLFYDWFLIPGSCKCWKSQFDFSKRSQTSFP